MPGRNSRILVTGTGVTGGEVLRQLTDLGIAPRALVRDPTKADAFAGLGVELVKGDFGDPGSWERALAGIDAVFVITTVDAETEGRFGVFLEAAGKAGVGHVVKLSGWRVSPTSEARVHQAMGRMDDALKASGLRHTILRPNSFFQNMFMLAGPIRAHGRFQSAAGDARISMIDVRDIAAVAVKVLTENGHAGAVYDMSGPEILTYFDVAAALSRALGRTITYVPLDPEVAINGMIEAGVPEPVARARVGVHASFANGVFTPTSDTVEAILGRPPLRFEQFAHDFADRFR